MYDIWTFVTSVVIRVTKLGVENLSIFEKEKSVIFLKMFLLKFLANPVLPRAQNLPAKAPKNKLKIDITSKITE